MAAAAVLSDGAHSYVYVAGERGALHRREVVVAPVNASTVAIVSGIGLADRVVVKGGILLDNAISLHAE